MPDRVPRLLMRVERTGWSLLLALTPWLLVGAGVVVVVRSLIDPGWLAEFGAVAPVGGGAVVGAASQHVVRWGRARLLDAGPR